ncbi:MAG TPA: carboxylating nicotinate-nucleotide diphosphorylase [Nocardioidaceae bacterium]|nr:carboxylating nicotinate-nucleotide diphosphorylase [Nocardioidaceae bacterium]
MTGQALGAHDAGHATREALRQAGLDPDQVLGLVRAALAEDLAQAGDRTSQAIVPVDARTEVCFTARAGGVLCGITVLAAMVADTIGHDATFRPTAVDGQHIGAGERLATLEAPARAVLALERTALNLLSHLSGIASITRQWVDALAGTGVEVRDTRKTMPLLRSLEKYAVRCGGGTNHRAGLYDQILVKDNHVAVAGGVGAALEAVRAAHPDHDLPVQVEVDSLAQLDEALQHGANQILLDNFDLDDLRAAVLRVRSVAPTTVLEASGGLRLENARATALTGVDLIAVGALTQSAPALDIGLDTVG